MLGCDYLDQIHNVGHATMFKKALPYLVKWDVENAALQLHQRTKHIMTGMHQLKLNQSMNLLKHAPILDEKGNIAPSNEHKGSLDWGIAIGFGDSPNKLLHASCHKHNAAKLFKDCSFTTTNGHKLPKFIGLTHDETYTQLKQNTHLPVCSKINFNTMPPRCCPTIMLQQFVVSRVGYDDANNREELLSVVKRLVKLNKPMLPPEKVPLQIDAWSLQGVTLPQNNSKWQHND